LNKYGSWLNILC